MFGFRAVTDQVSVVIFSARIRRMTEGNVFILSTISWGGGGGGGAGTPSQVYGWGGTLSKVWMVGGYPGQVWMVGGGVLQPGLDEGGYPSQVWMVGGTWTGLDGGGTLGTASHHYSMGSPPPWLDGVSPPPWLDGVPPTVTGWGTPNPTMTGWGKPPPPHTNIASTCYAAGGMPLAFTQEDFLVSLFVYENSQSVNCCSMTWITSGWSVTLVVWLEVMHVAWDRWKCDYTRNVCTRVQRSALHASICLVLRKKYHC